MDAGLARQLLGLGDEPLTQIELRRARNDSLKVHHPDLAGGDVTAIRIATHWSAQINAAFDFLIPTVVDDRQRSNSNESQTPRQSFADLAQRARQQAERDRAAR